MFPRHIVPVAALYGTIPRPMLKRIRRAVDAAIDGLASHRIFLAILAVLSFEQMGENVSAGLLSPVIDVAVGLIPALAFVGWTMIQKPSMFDVIKSDWTTYQRLLLAAALATVLGIITVLVGYKKDADPPG